MGLFKKAQPPNNVADTRKFPASTGRGDIMGGQSYEDTVTLFHKRLSEFKKASEKRPLALGQRLPDILGAASTATDEMREKNPAAFHEASREFGEFIDLVDSFSKFKAALVDYIKKFGEVKTTDELKALKAQYSSELKKMRSQNKLALDQAGVDLSERLSYAIDDAQYRITGVPTGSRY